MPCTLSFREMRAGGEHELKDFEGLVRSTARMFAAQVRREEEDLAQELRVRVWRAMQSYDPARSRVGLKNYVFSAVTNKIKDYKRDAAREAKRREETGVSFLHIEDMRRHDDGGRQEQFDGRYNFVTHEEVYRKIDEGVFVLPASVTKQEADVLLLLMIELRASEIMVRLGLRREEVERVVRSLRRKFADWKPSLQPDCSQVVELERLAA